MQVEQPSWGILESALGGIKNAETADALLAEFRKTVRDLGFDHYSMAIMPLDPGLEQERFLDSDFPRPFLDAYQEARAYRFDPYWTVISRSLLPVLHRDMVPKFLAHPNLQPVHEVGAGLNLVNGITIPIPSAGVARGVSFWYTGSGWEFERFAKAYGPLLHLLAIHFAAALESFRPALPDPEDGAPLSPRERDCLRLSALGFTSTEIGDRLGISERTVRFHVSNACEKLGAERRTEAVSRALRLGLIDF